VSLLEILVFRVLEAHVDQTESYYIGTDLGHQVVLVIQVLQDLQTFLCELIVLVVLRGIENNHRQNDADNSENESVQFDNRLRHLSGGDLFLKVNKLLGL
jgi:hypothetical protein